MRQMQKMEAVGQLTGGIAHDFNNMLAVIISAMNLAQRKLARGESDIGKLVEAATDAASRAANLTSRLLAFSRQQPLAPQVIDANRLVTGMSDILRRSLGEAIQIETVLAGGLWRSIRRHQPAGERAAQPGGQRPRRHARRRATDRRDGQLPISTSATRQPYGGDAGPVCDDRRDGHRHRHAARRGGEGARTLLHHQGHQQGDRSRPQPGLRLRQAVGRPSQDLLGSWAKAPRSRSTCRAISARTFRRRPASSPDLAEAPDRDGPGGRGRRTGAGRHGRRAAANSATSSSMRATRPRRWPRSTPSPPSACSSPTS